MKQALAVAALSALAGCGGGGEAAPDKTTHIQASQASRDGEIRHVVFSHQGGSMVMTQKQEWCFRCLVVIEASYFWGVRVSA